MTLIEKIKESIEGATGLDFLYHASGEINELVARAERLPVAFAFLIDSGTVEELNGNFHERVTLAVMFANKTQFDFNAIENEQIIDGMKEKAYKWLDSLRMSNMLRLVSVNKTQRLYDTTTDVLTGYAVEVMLQDMQGVGDCELPEVIIPINENGIYDVVGVDKVDVRLFTTLKDLLITENGEYDPKDFDAYGFGNVMVNVPTPEPELKDLQVTENGEYSPQDFGAYGFGNVIVNVPTPAPEPEKIRVYTLKINNNCLENGTWKGVDKIDSKYLTSLENFATLCSGLTEKLDLSSWDVSNVTNLAKAFLQTGSFVLDITGWNTSKVTSFANTFRGSLGKGIKIIGYENLDMSSATDVSYAFYLNIRPFREFTWDFRKIEIPKAMNASYFFPIASSDNLLMSLVGGEDINSVIANNTTILKGLKVSMGLVSNFYCEDRASLRALINGLADMTGQTAKTLTISGSKTGGQTTSAYDTLTEDDIAVATAKNWNVVKG